MVLNMIKTKAPYFIMLLLIGTYANYLFRHGFLIIDFIVCVGLSTYAILKPDTFFMFAKGDKYNFISALPWYSLILVIMPLGFMIANHINLISIDLVRGISITILMFLFLITLDRSRYN